MYLIHENSITHLTIADREMEALLLCAALIQQPPPPQQQQQSKFYHTATFVEKCM